MRSKRIGRWFVFMGLLLLAAALCLTVCNLNEQTRAARTAAQALQQMEGIRVENTPQPAVSAEAPAASSTAPAVPEHLLHPDMPMPELVIDGEAYVGIVTVPALELRLPVIGEWSYPRLKLAPCRYAGSAYRDDLIVMAHNYTGHFGRLAKLQPGDEVYFEDMNGNVFRYMVAAMETLGGSAIEDMTAGGWALTLFTCTVDGQSRVTIRCERAED